VNPSAYSISTPIPLLILLVNPFHLITSLVNKFYERKSQPIKRYSPAFPQAGNERLGFGVVSEFVG